MKLDLLHRRLAVLMGVAGLVAFAGGAGVAVVSAALAGAALLTALFWHPSSAASTRLERVWLPVALILVARALLHVFVIGGDVVIPVVDLLLLLLAAESLRSLDAFNDARLYALSFALLLAATAYRPGIVFAVAFVAYVVLGTVALTVGHLRRAARRHRVGEVSLDRAFVWSIVGLSGVTLLVSAVVFLTFPRVSRAWTGRGEVPTASIAGFSEEVSLGEHGATIYGNPQIVFRAEFPGGAPERVGGLHWRGRSYDHFDGVRWSRSRGIRPSSGSLDWYRSWSDSMIVQRIYGTSLDVRVLFALHPALEVDAESNIHPLLDNVGDHIYWGSAAPVYTARSVAGRPSAEVLREARGGFMPDPLHYLQLPPLADRVQALADSLTADLDTRYDRARALERWLQTEFRYTLDLPATAEQATLEHFLFERRAGHCEYFSTAMVILLRGAGIHARNVNGFLGGRWSELGDYVAVTQNEAHSWVEVWFPGVGWVTFDPTPSGQVGAQATAAWNWPGRFLFDALQHRWGKWVLDYDVGAQMGLLDRLVDGTREAVSRRRSPDGGGSTGLLWLVAALVAAAVASAWTLGRRERHPAATRLYLQLLHHSRRAGVVEDGPVAPLALLDRIRARAPAASEAAERVVSAYLRMRFSPAGESPRPLADMREALAEARRGLRTADGDRG